MSSLLFLLLSTLSFWSFSKTYGQPCNSKECLQVAAELKIIMNLTANACDDFSEYVCGNFDKKFHIPAGYGSYNIFKEMSDNVNIQLKELLTNKKTKKNTVQYKSIKLFNSCMNLKRRDKWSKLIMKIFLKKIRKQKYFNDKLLKLIKTGITSRWFTFVVGPDSKNPEYSILSIMPPSLIISREILVNSTKSDNQKNIKAYKDLMYFAMDYLNLPGRRMFEKIIELNIKIAKLIPEIYELNDPVKTYNKYTIRQLNEECSEINWLDIINSNVNSDIKVLSEEDSVILFSRSYLKNACKLLRKYTSSFYLTKILNLDIELAPVVPLMSYGSKIMKDKYDKYVSVLLGISGQKNKSSVCIDETSDMLPLILSNMFVKEYFNKSSRENILELIIYLKQTFHDVLQNEIWMDQSTNEMALLKLKTMTSKIGYSKYHLNQTFLENYFKKLSMSDEVYLQHIIAITKFDFDRSRSEIGKKIPAEKWEMSTFDINAYFNPLRNEIVFPAAILSPPFYSRQYNDILKYSAIGAVISHEMLHSFDTAGSQYDNRGVLKNWWTNETREKYNKRTQCIIDQYGNYEYLGEKLHSKQTIGEDIADNTGVQIAYSTAFSQLKNPDSGKIQGLDFTPEQLFFLKYARNWCTIGKPETFKYLMKTDVHSIWKYRINGPLSNMPQFSKAFKCSEDSAMNRKNKCSVW